MNGAFPQLDVADRPRVMATPDQLDTAERELGLHLPRSYRAFAQDFGYGQLCGLFWIYLPGLAPGCRDLVGQSRSLSDDLRGAEGNGWVWHAPDGSPELVARLVPFGNNESGAILAWDPRDEPEPGEYRIYVVGARYTGVYRAAGSLYEFVERALRPDLDGMMGRMSARLPATFVPAAVEP